jgi:steroid delta-isomerase-like uncharacterized protein
MPIVAPPSDATNAQLVRWAFDLLSAHNVAPLKRFWTQQTVERFPDRTCVGTEEIAAYFEALFAAVPDARLEVLAVAEQGDDVFVQWRMTGTHRGPLMGIEATGKRLAIDGIDHFVIREGKVVSNFVVVDQLQYARQIGMMPAEGSSADRFAKGAFNVATRLLSNLRR